MSENIEKEQEVVEKEQETVETEKKAVKKKREPLDKKTRTFMWVGAVIIALTLVGALVASLGGFGTSDDEYASELRGVVEGMYEKNAYLQLTVGHDEVIYMLYNNKKEAIAESQTGGKAVYRSDDRIVSMLSTGIAVDTDLSALRLVEIALDGVKEGYGKVTKSKGGGNTDTLDGMTEYSIEISGRDNIYSVYKTISDEYGAYITNAMFSTGGSVDKGVLKFTCSVGENGELGIRCFMVIEGIEYNSWYFDGYLAFDDWSLEKSWYTDDVDSANWEGLVLELDGQLQEIIDNYMLKNDYQVEEDSVEQEGEKLGEEVEAEETEDGHVHTDACNH